TRSRPAPEHWWAGCPCPRAPGASVRRQPRPRPSRGDAGTHGDRRGARLLAAAGYGDNRAVLAVLTRLRTELRSRWRAWAAVALLIGLTGGVVLTTAAGARRTDTAYARYLARAHAADVLVSPSNRGLPDYYPALAKLPAVSDLAVGVGPAGFVRI